jgi:hypothetical protein
MDWKYFIPHVWERERQVWEDVYLLPLDGSDHSQALWLTVDAIGNPEIPEHGLDWAEFQSEALQKLGDRPFHIEGTDMLIRAIDFSKAELLDWVRVWLRENGRPVAGLIEGTTEDFRGKAFHADLLSNFQYR